MRGRYEALTGVVDGVNTVFIAPTPYLSGTTAALLNGQHKTKDGDDGWHESNPAIGEITWKKAPKPGDKPQLYYFDPTGDTGVQQEVTPMTLVLKTTDVVTATIVDIEQITVIVAQKSDLGEPFNVTIDLKGE